MLVRSYRALLTSGFGVPLAAAVPVRPSYGEGSLSLPTCRSSSSPTTAATRSSPSRSTGRGRLPRQALLADRADRPRRGGASPRLPARAVRPGRAGHPLRGAPGSVGERRPETCGFPAQWALLRHTHCAGSPSANRSLQEGCRRRSFLRSREAPAGCWLPGKSVRRPVAARVFGAGVRSFTLSTSHSASSSASVRPAAATPAAVLRAVRSPVVGEPEVEGEVVVD